MGVLTHLDAFREPSKLKKAKKALKVSGGVLGCVCVWWWVVVQQGRVEQGFGVEGVCSSLWVRGAQLRVQ